MNKDEKDLQELMSDDEYFAIIQKQYQGSQRSKADIIQAQRAWRGIASKVSPAKPVRPAWFRYGWPILLGAACASFWVRQKEDTASLARSAQVASEVRLQLAAAESSRITVRSESSGFAAFYLREGDAATPIAALAQVALSAETQTLNLAAEPAEGISVCGLAASTLVELELLKQSASVLVPQLGAANCVQLGRQP